MEWIRDMKQPFVFLLGFMYNNYCDKDCATSGKCVC